MQREREIDSSSPAVTEDILEKGRRRKSLFGLPAHRPFVTVILCLMNIAAFVTLESMGGSRDLVTLVSCGAKIDALFWEGEYWRVFTALYLHLGLSHLLFNLYCLLISGTLLEGWRGHGWLLGVYLTSGLTGNFLSVIFSPSLSLGASGAVLGVIGALLVILLRKRHEIPSGLLISILAAFIPFLAFMIATPFYFSGIDSIAHIGGFLWGACYAFISEFTVPILREKKKSASNTAILSFSLIIIISVIFTVRESLRPQSASALKNYLFLGGIYSEKERWKEAITYLEKALSIDSHNEEALTILGSVLLQSGDLKKGVLIWERLIILEPGNSLVRNGLSQIYVVLGDEACDDRRFNDGFSLYRKSIDINPDNIRAYQQLSLYYEALGDYEKSLSLLVKALSLQSFRERDSAIMVKAREIMTKTVRVLCFPPHLKYHPNRTISNESLALTVQGERLLYETGQWEQALDCFHKAIQCDRENPVPWCRAGSLYLLLERDDRAGDYLTESIRLDHRYWEPWVGMGDLALRKREYDKARDCYLRSLSLQPAFPEGYAHMAQLSLVLNDLKKAEKEIEKAQSLDRGNPRFYVLEADIGIAGKNERNFYHSLTAALALARSMSNKDLEELVQKRLMRNELRNLQRRG